MRRLGAYTLLFGLVALPAFAGSGDNASEKPATAQPQMTSVPWYRYVFLGERTKPIPVKPAKDAPKPLTKDQVVRTLQEEQKVYLQRLSAISRIRQVAVDTGDKEMMKKANDLEKQAEEVYAQRTAALPGVGSLDDRDSLEAMPAQKGATADRSKRKMNKGDER